MGLARFADLTVLGVRQLARTVRDIAPEARRVLRKPAVACYVLLTAHRAQLFLAVSLALLVFAAPALVDFATGLIFPPESSKKILGLVTTYQEHPLKPFTETLVLTLAWAAAMSAVILLIWLHVPKAIIRAQARVRRLIAEADQLTDTASKRRLYSRALSLTTDPGRESELHSRLREVGQPGDAYAAGGKAESATEENTLIDGGETGGRSQSRRHSDEDGARPGLSGRYSLGQKLGKGAMGIVYRARDTVLDRNVALKQLAFRLAEDDEYAVRFRQEAKALARLTHPNVVQVFDLIEDGGKLWMVLEFVSGGDLASYLKKSGRLSIDSAVSLVLAVAEGLAYAHGQGIVHRDLKPANILLTDDLIPKISDFGIAKLTQSSGLTEVGAVLGSPPYMSPEQCSGGAVDARADVYALGITLYELLSGKVPFEGDTASVLTRQIVESPIALSQLRADIPENLERVVHQMLAKKPEDRPENMATVKERLSPFREESIAEHRKSNDYHNKRVRPL